MKLPVTIVSDKDNHEVLPAVPNTEEAPNDAPSSSNHDATSPNWDTFADNIGI